MSQTGGTRCTSPTPVPFNKDAWDVAVHETQQLLILAALPTVLQGVFIILCIASVYALIRGDGKAQVPSIVLALTLLALFTSTTVNFVYTILAVQSSMLNLLISVVEVLLPLSPAQIDFPRPELLFKDYGFAQECAWTSALSVNILLGDAIVCWRACVLWQGNRVVRAICALFLLAMFGLGLVDTTHICIPKTGRITSPRGIEAGFLYTVFSYGIAATALSFSTNVWATALVGYKALVSRRFVRKHVIAGSLGLQTERVLSLLLSFGAFYCVIWVIIVVRQVGIYAVAGAVSVADVTSFWEVYGFVVQGALVPVIAIYPTIVIFLVALNRSQIERGFGREHGDGEGGPGPARMPLRTITVTIGSVAEVREQADIREAGMHEVGIADVKHASAESGAMVAGGPDSRERGAEVIRGLVLISCFCGGLTPLADIPPLVGRLAGVSTSLCGTTDHATSYLKSSTTLRFTMRRGPLSTSTLRPRRL